MKHKKRCSWVNLKNPIYVNYHDNEWGKPEHNDNMLFELLTLEGAQAGLSWETVLNKREDYRKLFANFDPKKVSTFSQKKIDKLLENPKLIRNRLKIESTISNANAFIKVQKEFGSFDKYLWSFVDYKSIITSLKSTKDYPTKTDLSIHISKDLKKRGFRFVGETIIYSYMQAIGIVYDHVSECFCSWQVYMVRCNDNSLYTGISNNVSQRIADHNAQGPKTAKYLRGKNPIKLVYLENAGDKSTASKREQALKKLSKIDKEALIN